MSDEEQESGCDTVDGSPTSDSSGHDSPFAERNFVEDARQNPELVTSANTETKPAVCTVVVPPMGLENGLNADEHMANTGKLNLPFSPIIPLKSLNLGTSENNIAKKSSLNFQLDPAKPVVQRKSFLLSFSTGNPETTSLVNFKVVGP